MQAARNEFRRGWDSAAWVGPTTAFLAFLTIPAILIAWLIEGKITHPPTPYSLLWLGIAGLMTVLSGLPSLRHQKQVNLWVAAFLVVAFTAAAIWGGLLVSQRVTGASGTLAQITAWITQAGAVPATLVVSNLLLWLMLRTLYRARLADKDRQIEYLKQEHERYRAHILQAGAWIENITVALAARDAADAQRRNEPEKAARPTK